MKNRKETSASKPTLRVQTNRVLHEANKFKKQIQHEGKVQFDDLQSHIKNGSDKLMHQIKNKPLRSVLIAFGVGFLISRVFKG